MKIRGKLRGTFPPPPPYINPLYQDLINYIDTFNLSLNLCQINHKAIKVL